MKLKFLLFMMFVPVFMQAQVVCDYPEGVNTSLIISEVNMLATFQAYLEITNVGTEPVQLSDYKFGRLNYASGSSAINDLCNDPWYTARLEWMFLPNRILEPGKSFVIANAYDYNPIHYREGLGRLGGSERRHRIGMYEAADKLIHQSEPISGVYYERDSVTTALNDPEQLTKHGDYSYAFSFLKAGTIYLEHHYAEGDSAVIDQVGGVFDNAGRNFGGVSYDVAGVTGGVNNSVLIRKATVRRGNIDFANGRGIGLDDSEWMPVFVATDEEESYDPWREVFWTIGNHGSYVLDENTLESIDERITVDYSTGKITVPWGVRRLDDIMHYMKRKPGIAWRYDLNPLKEDSLYRSARNGDILTVFVAGNTLQSKAFEIEVKESTIDDHIVVPIDHPIVWDPGLTGPVTMHTQDGILGWPRVTRHDHGVDTITGYGFGLAFDLRTDTLLKYLEKPAKASWEFVWVDGVKRPDLKDGDLLRVTSESGKVKDYYLQVQTYRPNTNADLASITWPDIPEFYRGIFGWKGDTIPNFTAGSTNYRVEVPFDVEGVPALVAKASHVNAKVKVTRAKSLSGSLADRTVTFDVTAEDDTIHKSYQVELAKEKTPDKIEPFFAEPFISEFAHSYINANSFVEIYNPGNQPVDLRDYMFGYIYHTSSANDFWPVDHDHRWDRRYYTYMPGLKFVDQQTWSVKPRYMEEDPNVNAIVLGGETFVMALVRRGNLNIEGIEDYFPEWDVQFGNNYLPGYVNPWNENINIQCVPMTLRTNGGMALYKVLNDSIKRGLKPVMDPNDFKIVDIWRNADGGTWQIGNYVYSGHTTFIRKPHVHEGNPVRGASFGTDNETTEWIMIRPDNDYSHIPQPMRYGVGWSSLNQHYMIEPTFYKSTVNSAVYKVSDGFGPDEEILGLKTGCTVGEFLASINKEDEGQVLKITSAADGTELGMEAVLNKNDKLTVISADEKNTTVYRLDVTETGLSNNAYLSSSRWTVEVSVDPKSAGEAKEEGVGSISGFDYGTTIKTIIDNVNVPAGATLTVIDGDGAYVPNTILNFDTTYVSATVNPDIFIDVVAEDNVTRIVYQLQPNTSDYDAFILSDVYEVSQMDNLIHFVPRGTNFQAFLSNIIPSLGASLKLVDKMGFERVNGNIREDDKVVVISANGQNTRVYYISFLATPILPQTTYLAYVLSEAYMVNQVDYVISAGLATLTSETLLDEFVGYLMPSMGATMVVIDKNGEMKTSGDLNDGDKLVVTSADGKISTTYTLALDLTSAGVVEEAQRIEIWPNPANDRLQIRGVEAGNRIRIYSATGALIQEVKAQSNLESISLERGPSGMFLIMISDHEKTLGKYKAIRR